MQYKRLRWKGRRLPKYILTAAVIEEVPEVFRGSYKWGFVELEDRTLFIQPGYRWDGPTGPAIDTRNWMRASLVHDALCDLVRYGELPRMQLPAIHKVMHRILLEDGMSRFRAWYSWKIVSLLGERFI
jgi:hypothetical protein